MYVTADGLRFCRIGGPAEERHDELYGDGLVGIYDRKAPLGWFVDDVLGVAGQIGLLERGPIAQD